ncbi:hypothetical protein POM88_013398 [Heracleum sosnowskyi]|uniref:rRNA N-glycosylase n=1 Tax=Heracleum sosnowskyi TaxID=360622 RepID=A0AAD8IYA2_9APIA|nr:hypothetical protein POM88_013398 [Heracleum sosnowskyi]
MDINWSEMISSLRSVIHDTNGVRFFLFRIPDFLVFVKVAEFLNMKLSCESGREQHPDFPFRVFPRATNTSVFAESFDVQMNADRVPMQLFFLKDDVYVVSWKIRGPNSATPRYAVFLDHKGNFETRAVAVASSNHRKLPGIRVRGRFLPRRGEATQPPKLDTMFMVAELAKPTTYKLPFSGQYGDLVQLSMDREELISNKYTQIDAFQVIYNAETERNVNRLAESALKLLQMVSEPMRNARMKRALVDCFDGVGRFPKEIIARKNKWGSSCKKLHLIPVDDSGLTDKQRAENLALIAEWTLIKASRD